MADTFDVAVALSGGVSDPSRAWDFVRRFAAEWTPDPLRPQDGFTQDELDASEAELGFELPEVLRHGYRLFGRRADLTAVQDPLVPPAGLFVSDGLPDGILVFRRENQDCAAWGIPLDRIEQDDPPVVVESHDRWIPFLDRMSTAWVELVLSESLLGAGTCYDACELPEALLPNLYDRYARVPLPDHPMWVGPQDSPLRWYSAPGRLIRRDGDLDLCWVHARGRTADDLETLRRDLPASWVC
ncbi:SMI1/KNR4 family protein [Streptomyces adustus]|uniref:SMI1/KNR4 family protein n=1 Tax=Streptomyces adustus TaxID=1609272 RepID=UPI00371C91DF